MGRRQRSSAHATIKNAIMAPVPTPEKSASRLKVVMTAVPLTGLNRFESHTYAVPMYRSEYGATARADCGTLLRHSLVSTGVTCKQ